MELGRVIARDVKTVSFLGRKWACSVHEVRTPSGGVTRKVFCRRIAGRPIAKWEWDDEIAGTKARVRVTESTVSLKYDPRREIGLIRSCLRAISELFSNPNKFERRLARMEGVDIKPKVRNIHYSFVITTDAKGYFCVGSAGPGTAKVFWTPYTARWDKKMSDNLFRFHIGTCAPCAVATHETEHALCRSGAEFEDFKALGEIYFRFKNPDVFADKDMGESLLHSRALTLMNWDRYKRPPSYMRKARNFFCAVYTRYPKLTVERLKKEGWSSEALRKIISLCK